MQNLVYFTRQMNISQSYTGTYSHVAAYQGNPRSYPIDETGNIQDEASVYAPCDCVIRRIYGVGNTGTNTIWIESLSEVRFADGFAGYWTGLFMHPNDSSLRNLKEGQTFNQYQEMFKTGKDGKATGNHVHQDNAKCRFNQLTGNGWIQNSKEAWIISVNQVPPEKVFFIDTGFTKIVNACGLTFKNLPSSTTPTNSAAEAAKAVAEAAAALLNKKFTGEYNIQNIGSGKMLNVFATPSTVKQGSEIRACNNDGTPEQKFRLDSSGSGKYHIISLINNAGYCVDTYGSPSTLASGAKVHVWTPSTSGMNIWIFDDLGNDCYVIRSSLNAGLALTAVSADHRANVIVQTYSSSNNLQKWRLTR